MAVVLGGFTNLASGTGTRSFTSPTTASKAYGVVVISGGAVEETSGVTWGGVPMSREFTGANTGGEDGTTSIWFLAQPGTGGQTVEITRSGATAYIATAFDGTSATGSAKVETGDTYASTNTSATTLSVTIPNGVVVALYGGLYSGENALSSVTDNADLTRRHSVDFGNFVSVISQKTTLLTGTGAAYTNFAYTQSSDDAAAAVIAISEALPATTVSGSFTANAELAAGGGGGGGGAIAFVKQVASYSDGGAASTSHAVPITSAPATGNHLIMGVVNPGNIATVSATDSAGNVWTAREKRNSGTTLTLTLLECYVANPLTTSDTITVSLSSSQGAGITVNEYSGGDPAGWYISSAAGDSGGVGATTYDSTAAPTAGAAGDLKVGLLAMSATSAGITQNESNFTARSTVASVTFVRTLYPFDGILAASSENQFSGSYTTTRQNSAVIGLFKAAAAGGGTVSGSFTANAILRNIVSGSFTANSVLLKTTSATFTADAVLTKVTSATFTADAILRGTPTGSLTANAILRGVASSSFTADSVLRKTVSATFTADASLSANPVGTFTADAIIRGTTAGTFTADAVLRATAAGTFTSDAVIRGTTAATFTADAVISAAGGDGVITVGSGTRTENGENVSTLSVSSMPTHASGDRLVVIAGWKNQPLRTHTTPSGWTQVDVVDDGSGFSLAVFTKVAASSSETFSMALSGSAQWSEVQAWHLSASNVGTPASLYDSTSDASYEVPGLTFSTDGTGQVLTAVMTSRGDRGIYALTGTDTSLRGGGEHHSWAPWFALSTMWDAFTGTNPAATTGSINNGNDVTLAIRVGFKGGVEPTTYSGSFTADAILRKTESATFTADSVLRKTASATFTADSVLRKTTSATFTSDALLRATVAQTFTANAVLLKTTSPTFTADAVLKKTTSATLTADAILMATRPERREFSRTWTFGASAENFEGTYQSGFGNPAGSVSGTISGAYRLQSTETYESAFGIPAGWVVDSVRVTSVNYYITGTATNVRVGFLGGGVFANVTDNPANDTWLTYSQTSARGGLALASNSLLKNYWSVYTDRSGGTGSSTIYFDNLTVVVTAYDPSAGGWFQTDAILRKTVESSFTANAVLRRVESATIIADAIVKATRTSIPYSERVLRLSPIAYWRLGDGEPSPTNLLAAKNPSFEDASLSDWYNAGMGNTFVRDNSTAQDGTWSIALQRGAGTGTGNLRILSNPAIAATAGVRYTVRAWRKSGTSRLAIPIIAFYNSSGANVGDTGVGTGNGLRADGSGDWIEQTASGVAPATATGLRAGVYFVDNVPEGEVHYADNIRVFVTPTVTESVAGYPSYRRGLIPSISGGLASDPDTAMDFPGTPASFIEVPSVPAFNPDYVSIVGWFKLDPSANATGTMLRRGGSGYSYWIRFANTGKQVEARIYTAEGVFAGGQYGVNLNDDQWHFAAMTWDGTTFRLYVDGVQTNTSTATSGVLYHDAGTAAIGIGSHSAGTSEMMNGGLDEVALFGYALSAADIASLYDAGFTSPNLDISADSVLRKEFGGTFTSDAILRKVEAGSFTANAFLKAVVSGNFTANAVLFKTTASTFTADAYLQSAVSGTFTANAVLFKSTSATFTSDATLRRVEAFTFTGNAVLRRVESGSFTSDALLRAISSGTFTADAYMVSRVSSSFTANAVLRTTVASSYTADAHIRRTETFSATANAVLRKTLSATFTVDAVLRSTGIGSLTADAVLRRIVAATPTADATLRRTESGTFAGNAILRSVVASSFTADAMLRTIGSGNWSADAVIRKAVADAFTADASLRRIESFTFAANAVIKKTQDNSFTADAYLVNLVEGEGNFSADAILRRVESFTFTADAYMVSRVSGSFTANAILLSSQSNSASADAILLVESESTFTANAVLRGSTALTVDSNAVLRKESGGSYTADAILRTIVQGSFLADAIVRRVQSYSFTADAFLAYVIVPGAGVFTANAVLKSTETETFTADAMLRNIRSATFTADARLLKIWADSFTADSHIVHRTESAFAANAVIRRVETGSFTADAVIVGTYTGEYVVSVTIEETLQVSVESFPTMVVSTSESPTMEIDTETDRTVGIEVTVERTL